MPVTCPCCALIALDEIGHYDICPRCMWEDDGYSRYNIDTISDCNHMSLRRARAQWAAEGDSKKEFKIPFDPNTPEDPQMLKEIQNSIHFSDKDLIQKVMELLGPLSDHASKLDVNLTLIGCRSKDSDHISEYVDKADDASFDLMLIISKLCDLFYCKKVEK
jgi:hypothetical protein